MPTREQSSVNHGSRQAHPAATGKALSGWQVPPLPPRLRAGGPPYETAGPSLTELASLARSRLTAASSDRARARMESSLTDWLHQTIRLNIKRGRLFEIERVLTEGQADCMGFARVFHQLGGNLGLDAGIVEVLIDNAGRPVPHVINIVRLSDGRRQFVDLWYGSSHIRHRRLALAVREEGRWRIVDADRRQLRLFSQAKGLPPRCINAITSYMIGNRHLEQGIRSTDAAALRDAVRCYTAAIARYPQNARLYFNRAVARERLGHRQAAEADYAVAFRDESSLIRIQARQHDEVVRLMALDRIGVSSVEQEMYLLLEGFITGREVPPERVAARYRVSADEVRRTTSYIKAKVQSMSVPSSA